MRLSDSATAKNTLGTVLLAQGDERKAEAREQSVVEKLGCRESTASQECIDALSQPWHGSIAPRQLPAGGVGFTTGRGGILTSLRRRASYHRQHLEQSGQERARSRAIGKRRRLFIGKRSRCGARSSGPAHPDLAQGLAQAGYALPKTTASATRKPNACFSRLSGSIKTRWAPIV